MYGEMGNERGLIILAPRKHHHICRGRLDRHRPRISILATASLLEEAHNIVGHTAQITAAIRRHGAEQALTSLFGEVGLLEDALGGVDVGQVEGSARVARVEDGGETHAGLEGAHHDAVHLVVGDVAGLAEVDRVDDLVVAVFLIAVKVFCLPAVSYAKLGTRLLQEPEQSEYTYQSSGRRASRSAGRP